MLTASDSFIAFLSESLAGEPEVFWFRQSEHDVHSGLLKHNCLNVQLLGFFEDGSLEMCLTSLDLLVTNERQGLTWLKTIRDLLIDVQVIDELDYSMFPELPIDTGRSVSWDGREIDFLNVRTPSGARYVHYNATFPLVYTRL